MVVCRNTKQKQSIINCLKTYKDEHLSANDILDILKRSDSCVSVATVYRNLAKLMKDGQVRKYKVGDKGGSCYQYIDKNSLCYEHYHLLCSNCSKTVHFQNNELSGILNSINCSDDFHIDSPKTVFYGLCSSCIKNESKAKKG